MPTYSTDLITINTADGTDGSQPTGWAETSGHRTGAQVQADEDLVIQGTSCVSKQSGNATGVQAGMSYEGINVRNQTGWVDGQSVVLYWWNAVYPNALQSFDFGPTTGVTGDTGATVSGGFLIGIGNAQANQRYFKVGGNDKYCGPFGGWQNTALEHVNATVAYTDGIPTAVYDTFRVLPVYRQSVRRGNSMAMDVIRWAPRGKISVTSGGGGTASLSRIAEFDSRNSTTGLDPEFTVIDGGQHKLGLFQQREGFFLWKGQLEVNTALEDSNKSVVLQDCPTVYSDFTELLVQSGASVTLENVSFTAEATSPRQGFFRTNGSGVLDLTGCVFLDTSRVTPTSSNMCSYVRCSFISPLGTFKDNTVTECVDLFALSLGTSLLASGSVTGNTITKGTGTSHAVDLTGGDDFVWDNTLIGYEDGSVGTPVTTTSTGNEAIRVRQTFGTINISVAAGATIPSIRSDGATVNVTAQQTTLTITGVKAGSDVVIRSAGTTTKLLDVQDLAADGDVTYEYTYSAGTFIDVAVFGEGFVPFFINGFELGINDGSLPVAQVIDRNYIP